MSIIKSIPTSIIFQERLSIFYAIETYFSQKSVNEGHSPKVLAKILHVPIEKKNI